MISRVIDKIIEWIGHPLTSGLVVLLVAIDLIWGWRSGFPSSWISGNGAATGLIAIILLVFLQHSTNRVNRALHAKLDVQIAADEALDNRLIGAEKMPAHSIKRLHQEAVEQVKEAVEEAGKEAAEG